MKQNHRQQGFTLIEVIVVMVVVGVLMAMGLKGYYSWYPNMRLKAAARDVYSTIQKTRLEAIKTNRDIALVFDSANDKYVICSSVGIDGLWNPCDGNDILESRTLTDYKNGIEFGRGDNSGNDPYDNDPQPTIEADFVSYDDPALPVNDNVLVFSPSGLCNSGFVYLHNEDNTLFAVGTLVSGVTQMARWQGGAWK